MLHHCIEDWLRLLKNGKLHLIHFFLINYNNNIK